MEKIKPLLAPERLVFLFGLEAPVGIFRTLMIFSSLISEIWDPLMNHTSSWTSSAAAWTPSPLPLEHQGVVCKSLLAVQVYGLPHSPLGRPLVWPESFYYSARICPAGSEVSQQAANGFSASLWWPRQLNHVILPLWLHLIFCHLIWLLWLCGTGLTGHKAQSYCWYK